MSISINYVHCYLLQVDKLEEDISKKLEEHVDHDNKPIIMRKFH